MAHQWRKPVCADIGNALSKKHGARACAIAAFLMAQQRRKAMLFTIGRFPRDGAHRRRKMKSIPYASATSGNRAREEVIKILRRFGCEKLGFMDDDANHEVVLYFEHRGRSVRMPVSAKGWAQKWLKENPLSYRARKSKFEHEQDALRQGHVAVSSILRDWVKGQITAVETGMLSFEAVFMAHMLTNDGRPLIERVKDLVPDPEQDKVVALPSKSP
jgi:hypothetical protein